MIKKKETAGFSLIEVCLALLILAIGITAVIGLFPAILNSTRKAVSEAEVASFATFVFSSLDSVALLNWNMLENGGIDDASLTSGGNHTDPHIVQSILLESSTTMNDTILHAGGGNAYNNFQWIPDDDMNVSGAGVNDVITHFTYTLNINNVNGFNQNLKEAKLVVWPGNFTAQPPRNIISNVYIRTFYRGLY